MKYIYHATIGSCQLSFAVFWYSWPSLIYQPLVVSPSLFFPLSSVPHLAPSPPSLPPRWKPLLLTDVALYLCTLAHLPRPELSLSPIHGPLGSCISRGHYEHTSQRHMRAVRLSAVRCQPAINTPAICGVSIGQPSHAKKPKSWVKCKLRSPFYIRVSHPS